jgi:putative DNA primase/helicase
MSRYIDDPEFSSDVHAVREHYERLEGVYTELATLGDEHPTLAFAGNDGWYQYREVSDVDALEDGWDTRARCTTLERDWQQILEQVDGEGRAREIFNITTWKDPDAVYQWTQKRDNEDGDSIWKNDEKPTPGYGALRGFGFWCDLDLSDKAGRATLSDAELQTVENVQQHVIEHVAGFYGVDTGAVYGLDSGGGAYVYGPPEAALPLTEYLDDGDCALLFDDIRERMRDGLAKGELDGFEGIWPTVTDEIEGAAELLDPDWIQNVNRQTKAPGAIHHSHELVVTPLRRRNPESGEIAGSVDYTPTLVSDVDRRLVAQLETWATGLTEIEHTGSAGTFIENLYPGVEADGGWKSIVDARLEVLQQREETRTERREAISAKLDEWAGDGDGDGDVDIREAHESGSTYNLRSTSGEYSGSEVTADVSEVMAAIETIDVADVVRNHSTHHKKASQWCNDCEICDAIRDAPQTDEEPCGECHACYGWDTSSRTGEITFDPCWRKSGSGQSVAIPIDSDGEAETNTFVDNGCNAGGGPVKAYALGEVTGYATPTDELSDVWGRAVDAMREDGYNIPVWVPDADDDANEYGETPLWALRKAAVALEVVAGDEFVERESEDGSYLGFPDAETYNNTLDALESEGIAHGRQRASTDDEKSVKELVAKHSSEYDSVEEVPDNVLDSSTEGESQDGDPDRTPTWQDVRAGYQAAERSKDISKGPARQAAQQRLEEDHSWMYVKESQRLWVYDEENGTYNEWGEEKMGEILVDRLAEYYARSEKGELVNRISQTNSVHRADLNARGRDDPLLCAGNGVVNLRTGEIHSHSPKYCFVRGLEWDYPTEENGLTVDRETVLDFLDSVTERVADRDTLLDHLGHGLMPGHPYRAFIVCYGPGGNGKTQVARLFRAFVGGENAASVEIGELVNDDFATSDLVGKFINWGDDMSGDGGGTLDDISNLKKASGGSYLRSNEKYEKTFDFKNQAAMFFSANEPPRIGEVKPSIKDRLYPIEMPMRFLDPDSDEYEPDNPLHKPKVPNYAESLIEDDAVMRGVLDLAVEHAQQLQERRGGYSQPESPDERFRRYNQEADPIVRFAYTALESAGGEMMVRKDDVYRVYQSFTDSWEERAAGARGFKRQLPRKVELELEGAKSRPLATADDESNRVPAWKRVTWTGAAREHMPEWMIERYEDHWGSGEQSEDAAEPDDETPELAELATGMHQAPVKATIAEKIEPPEWLEGKGHIVDEVGGIMPYVIEAGDPLGDVAEGDTITIENVKVEDRDGVLTAVFSGISIITVEDEPEATAAPDDGQRGLEATADGGTTDVPADATGPKADARRLAQAFKREGVTAQETAVSEARAAGKAPKGMSPETVTEALEKGHEELGLFAKTGDGDYYLLD